MGRKLTVLNAENATFSCVYPTCGGACCKGSRPPATPAEVAHLRSLLPRVMGRLRPGARRAIEKRDFVTRRQKSGNATLAVQDGACVFFHDGCTLHVLAVEEGVDRFAHKPWACTIFPLERHDEGTWHIRQHGAYGEAWDELPCLSPDASDARGIDSLAPELAFASELATGGSESWRFTPDDAAGKATRTAKTKPGANPSEASPPPKPPKPRKRGARPTSP